MISASPHQTRIIVTSPCQNSSSCDLQALPIGVFDSGVGGLTVLSALRSLLPHENLIYLGDTARVPYGTKSADSIMRYAMQAAELLVERGVKMVVIACNTASSVALESLRSHFAPLPVLGVVMPGARAGCEHSTKGVMGVIGTESTISGGAYQKAIRQLNPEAEVVAAPCSLLVALAEEGWVEGEIVEAIVKRYLTPLFATPLGKQADVLILGCTHFPLLSEAISSVCGPQIKLVDSARTTAEEVVVQLRELGLTNLSSSSSENPLKGEVKILVTDGPERFARVAAHFFDEPIDMREIELVDIQLTSSSVKVKDI
jgi:glutamate racemase